MPRSVVDETRDAIRSARDAFDNRPRPRMEPKTRSELMLKTVDGIISRQSELAGLEALSSGATIRKASMIDVPLAIEHFRHFAELA